MRRILSKIIKALFIFDPRITLSIVFLSFLALFFVVIGDLTYTPFAYFALAFSVYAMVCFIFNREGAEKVISDMIFKIPFFKDLKNRAAENGSEKILKDNALLVLSFVMNTAYALYYFICGIKHSSIWFGVAGLVYMTISFIKLLVMWGYNKKKNGEMTEERKMDEERYYRVIGLLVFSVCVLIITIIWQFPHTDYTGAYVTGFFFTSAVFTIIFIAGFAKDLMDRNRNTSPVIKGIMNLNILRVIMALCTFPQNIYLKVQTVSDQTSNIVNTVLFSLMLLLSVYMIISATVHLNGKKGEAEEANTEEEKEKEK